MSTYILERYKEVADVNVYTRNVEHTVLAKFTTVNENISMAVTLKFSWIAHVIFLSSSN